MIIEAEIDPEFIGRSFQGSPTLSRESIVWFVLDQTLRGGLFDVMETFQLSVSPVVHKCDSRLFCIGLLLYRLSIGLTLSAFIFGVFMIIRDGLASLFGRRTRPSE